MDPTRLVIVGGFLGAGKTTLLWEAAQRIINSGQRVGLITNDQAHELVDTALLSRNDVKVAEVSGSCFCCNFDGLINAMKEVRKEAEADVIIAEPVGSCTDLSATIFQPLKENMRGEMLLAPLSVMADPVRLTAILDGDSAGLHTSAAYIFRKQLEESDIILISKTDTLAPDDLGKLKVRAKRSFPGSEIMGISAKNGKGIDEWLNEVLHRTDAGRRLVQVDYDVYAEGEAVLGWLNSSIILSGETTDWDKFAQNFLKGLSRQFDSAGSSVGHVKIMLESGNQYLAGNLTGKGDTLSLRQSAGTGTEARLTINARVEMSPEALEKVVRETLDTETKDKLEVKILAWRCLSPGRPNPTFRFNYVVPAK
jgi:G3E family GTPase